MYRAVSYTLLVTLFIAPNFASAEDSSSPASPSSRKVVEKIEPVYPMLARRNHLTGSVKLRVLISPDGRARDIEVLGGNPVFVDNATESVKKWKWSSTDRETTEVVELKFNSGT
jgi:TonB family protein